MMIPYNTLDTEKREQAHKFEARQAIKKWLHIISIDN